MSIMTTVRVIKKGRPVTDGRRTKEGEETEIEIEASVQPLQGQEFVGLPQGVKRLEGRVIYVAGDVTLDIGDKIIIRGVKELRITRLEQDWREIAGYAKYIAEEF